MKTQNIGDGCGSCRWTGVRRRCNSECRGTTGEIRSERGDFLPPFRGALEFCFTAFTRTGPDCERPWKNQILILRLFRRDGRWIVGWAALPGGEGGAFQAFSLTARAQWSPRQCHRLEVVAEWGHLFYFRRSSGRGPKLHRSAASRWAYRQCQNGGFASEQDIARLPGARRIDALMAVPGPSPDVYAFHRGTTQRNLYRIPVQ